MINLSEYLTEPNVIAFLKTIRKAEGTASENGYKILFGGKLFESFADHPHVYSNYTDKAGKEIKTSAAGAYQIIYPTWKVLKERLRLTDFSPTSQDLCALELIREAKGLNDVLEGKFHDAVEKIKSIWASMPSSGNNQPERSVAEIENWYKEAGGTIIT